MKTTAQYKTTWVTTVTSIIALLFTILVALGKVTPEQSAEAQTQVLNLLGYVTAAITAIAAIIAIFKGDT